MSKTMMEQQPESEGDTKRRGSVISKYAGRLVLFALIAGMGWFYWWTALPPQRGKPVVADSRDYYNLLARGFLKGHLYLDADVDPALAKMKNPLDPIERAGHGLHDASYFNNKYYLYFGPTAEVLLFVPFRLITGKFVSESCASVLFSITGMLASIWLLSLLRRRCFPGVSGFVFGLCVLALGMATMVPVLLRRPSVWEVPITCAYACFTLAFAFLFKGITEKRRNLYLCLASLAMGLSVASRPVYLFGCVALFVPPLLWSKDCGGVLKCWRNRAWVRSFLACLAPVSLVGLSLAAYNYARFGDVLEFGQRYQMAGDQISKLKLFDWAYPAYGFRIYLLEPAGFNRYFPFFSVISPPPAPPGHLGVENPYGVFPNLPFAFLTLGLIAAFWGEERKRQLRPLSVFCVSLAAGVILTMATVMSFGGITNRYMVDFVPGIMIFACIGLLSLAALPSLAGVKRIVLYWVATLLTIYSCVFNILVSLQHNEQLRAESPKQYRQIAHAANHLPYLWDRLTGVKYGPVELKLVFPTGLSGKLECLIATGTSFRSDYIYVYYLGDNMARFGFEHTSRGGQTGQPFQIKPGKEQTVRVDMGSLYPPEAHPYFDHLPRRQARLVQRTVRVAVDGEVVLDGIHDCYDATSKEPSIGTSGNRPGFDQDFSGRLISARRAADALPEPPPIEYGPIKIRLKFPPFAGERSEPIVCSGESGKGDLIFVRYLDSKHVLFGHDNWGGGGRNGDPVVVDYAAEHVVEVDYGSLYPAEGAKEWNGVANRTRVVVKIDGAVALDQPAPFHPSASDAVIIGSNSIQASSSFPVFTGTITSAEREPSTDPKTAK